MESDEPIIKEYHAFLNNKEFPCIAAKGATARNQIRCMVATHMGCPADDAAMLKFLYLFIDNYRVSNQPYHSAAIIFKQPAKINEDQFDMFLWQRLNSLAALDKLKFEHDPRVDSDPMSPRYCFSLKAEAFFIIGLHPGNSRRARQFTYPTLVFNPHEEFERLRKLDRYNPIKEAVRRRDIAYSGTINPMLEDYGSASEVYQYSGRRYQTNWTCPLKHR